MSQSYDHLINASDITDIRDVLVGLELLEKKLPNTVLRTFAPFNRAYIVVTQTIENAMQEQYFSDNNAVDQLCVDFAQYYFEALNSYVRHSQLPAVWRHLSPQSTIHHIAFLSLLYGASAHINGDLPQALRTSHISKNDYYAIDTLLHEASTRILNVFEESNFALNFLKKRSRFF